MTRSKPNKNTKKYLKHNKGFYGRKKNCLKLAKQYYIKSLFKKYIDKKNKKRLILKKKIALINFFSRIYFGLSYSKFVYILKINNCKLNKNIILFLLLKTIV
ncbi:ribosomal protein L20 [Candidatus Carsonella ruddii PV]|uniref:Large ribosomal subunit protein bL20 n=1 Tax=Carsonella ruddii (strain PV) TaxID=387662 RepID=RL20_CARRP|nr:50S ribosomal protein L20 [Candidatus Carsonella ruddii]Q05FQ0.1 RecName: Full=Large ribosomal subunit protein bL20; AltName: Full=50S ribosomal protein L20 [Candidatus Carsonella ruddii PV]BAF35121.1 ribosomal protein L20 [Candidatus Carsonella ruddii PV]